ncbi:SMP-30/gluconolactonase/LRE family protein [Sphingomonas phyllosphaerae]|uniref:SMP-30/gluconolactonase/LRE family protein n=1 Tax=Sphingomonas phyllosphaerae TaxID=257003 RepID=UPI0024134889|nr:SMP-30/gluconolactonase/LRE family protein [Sphingomonas phyllosphaerae]
MTALTRRAALAGLGAGLGAGALLAGAARAAEPPPMGVLRLDPRLDSIIPRGATIETLATGYRWAEGPVWVAKGEYLLFSDVPANVVHRWSRRDGARPFLDPSGLQTPIPPAIREAGANGLALDHRGRLIVADSGTRAIVRVDLATRKRTVLADRYRGKRFNSPNDVVVARSGAIYFTDPTYGFAAGPDSPLRELDVTGLYRLDPDGTVTLLDGARRFPNGVGLSPDERTLYLSCSDDAAPLVWAYTLDARGSPTGSRVFSDMRADKAKGWAGAPDGMDVAAAGHLFVSGPGGMHVLSPAGEPLGIIGNGRPIANACVGEGGRSLFLTASDRICRVALVG